MAQYDVFRTSQGPEGLIPFVVDIQANILRDLGSRVVIPLYRPGAFLPVANLHPVFVVEGMELVLGTHEMAAVPVATLKQATGSLAGEWHRISRAVDVLLSGV